MKKSLLGLLVVSLVLTGASCGSDDKTTTKTAANTAAAVSTVKVNEAAKAGDISHTVTLAEKMDTIPASKTVEDFKSIAKDKKAADGFTWVHLTGKVTNNSSESENVSSNSLTVVDDSGKEYDLATDVTIYVPDDKFPTYIDIQPTQTVEWEAYYLVPTTAKGLKLKVNDLQILSDNEALVDLGL